MQDRKHCHCRSVDRDCDRDSPELARAGQSLRNQKANQSVRDVKKGRIRSCVPIRRSPERQLRENDCTEAQHRSKDRNRCDFELFTSSLADRPQSKQNRGDRFQNENRPGFNGTECQRREQQEADRTICDEFVQGLNRHRVMHGDAENVGGHARNGI